MHPTQDLGQIGQRDVPGLPVDIAIYQRGAEFAVDMGQSLGGQPKRAEVLQDLVFGRRVVREQGRRPAWQV